MQSITLVVLCHYVNARYGATHVLMRGARRITERVAVAVTKLTTNGTRKKAQTHGRSIDNSRNRNRVLFLFFSQQSLERRIYCGNKWTRLVLRRNTFVQEDCNIVPWDNRPRGEVYFLEQRYKMFIESRNFGDAL